MKPTMFVGSSSEGQDIAKAISIGIKGFIDATPWIHGNIFDLSDSTLSSLVCNAKKYDLGLFVLTLDDETMLRRVVKTTARDNVVFEPGLFMGHQGVKCVYFTIPEGRKDFHMPSDLSGITALPIKVTRGKNQCIDSKSLKVVVDTIKAATNKLMGKSHGNSSLCGKWKGKWTVKNSDSHPEGEFEFDTEILQLGDKIRTYITTKNIIYNVSGTITNNKHIAGSWGDEGKYFGVFQIFKHPMQNKLSGKWVGFKENNVVDSGDLEFSRI